MKSNYTAYICAAMLVLTLLSGCSQRSSLSVKPKTKPLPPAPVKTRQCSVHFREAAYIAGLNYRWNIPGPRPFTILQTMKGGCAFLDYNNDGFLDILLIGQNLALYQGDGKGHFADVSEMAGLANLKGNFFGCAIGDYDNDGFQDIYLSGYHTGVLLHNRGARESSQRTVFTDVTAKVGLKPQPWGTSCAWADIDGDGWLDLVVCNYVDFDSSKAQYCPINGVRTSCTPLKYAPLSGVVFRNEHGSHFRDVTKNWGAKMTGNGLGVACADYDGSGWIGFAVANDNLAGDLFQNSGKGHLTNIGAASGTAFNMVGSAHAGMGIDWGDYDNDGRPDLFVATFLKETKSLYHNEGNALFHEVSDRSGIEGPAWERLSFGCKFLDADNDGWLDAIIANGHVSDTVEKWSQYPYRQHTLFYLNSGSIPVHFQEEAERSGLNSIKPIVGRGLAVGDYDNDGRIDVLVVDLEGKPQLLHNETPKNYHWLGLKLIGTGRSNRDAYGATVTLEIGTRKIVRFCHADGSYLSSSDSRVHIGLGSAAHIDRVTIHWPDGSEESRTDLSGDRYYTWRESGMAATKLSGE